MFRVELKCSCHVDLIPGNLPVFIMAEGCTQKHMHLNPYADASIKQIKNLSELDVAADHLMMDTENYELMDGLVWQ